ncbi:MAG: hypothetical protein CL537_08075 [Alcanivoracaceae bacterium]|nr:hypothetical protein [Alcanivoracaceae bacterium]|tara:strand:- start:3093 stop:4433 length:1341 start_codon:yes stop_codon:yes gene_type:complete
MDEITRFFPVHKALLLLSLVLGGLIPGLSQAANWNVDLFAGQARTFALGTVTRVAVGNPDVVNYKVLDDGNLLLIGVQPGISTVSVWKEADRQVSLEVSVTPLPVDRQMKVAEQLASHVDGLTVETMGQNLVFKGRVSSEFTQTINRIIGQLPGAINLVRDDGFEKAELVRLDVKIVELKRQDIQKLGVRWDSEIAGPAYGLHAPVTTNPVFGVISPAQNGLPGEIRNALQNANYPVNSYDTLQYFGATTGITSTIDAMAEAGNARILTAPRLIARSGATAEFQAGGEFPIPVINQDGFTNVDFRDYGVLLSIAPLVQDDDIMISLAAEVSNIDPAVQVNGIPGLLNRSTSTTINLKNHDSLVVSGLISNVSSSQTQKVPFLGDIPILGKLFSSKDDRVEEAEVLIMVTPHIVQAEDDDNQALVSRVQSYVEDVKLDSELDTLLLE